MRIEKNIIQGIIVSSSSKFSKLTSHKLYGQGRNKSTLACKPVPCLVSIVQPWKVGGVKQAYDLCNSCFISAKGG